MKGSSSEKAWIMRPRPRPQARIRLFCFPYSGASASIFYQWPESLPSAIEVCAVQLPGRGNRLSEPPITAMPALIDALAPAFQPFLDKPFALFGHSLGAVVAFELARRLRRDHDVSPHHLIVSGHTAPQIPDRRQPIHSLPDDEFVAEMRKLNGTPDEILQHEELLHLLLPILRADFALSETYVYEPGERLTMPMAAFGGLNDPFITREELDAWRVHTTATFQLRMFPGDHFFLNSHRSVLLHALARELAAYAN